MQRLNVGDEVRVANVSAVYETAPVGITDQPEFLNLAVSVHTVFTPEALLSHALKIETALGRVRRERWGPRTIDIDLLWYEGVCVTTPELTLPHPRMTERAFVVVPLAEIAGHLVIAGESVATRAACCDREGLKKIGALPRATTVEKRP